MQTIETLFFVPATLVSTIDFGHIVPLSVTLTLSGSTRAAESKMSWLHFLAHFSTEWDEISCGVEAVQVERPDNAFGRDGIVYAVLTCWSDEPPGCCTSYKWCISEIPSL